MRLVVTGNIGCGKSTVCQMLRELLPGYELFSVDDAVRALYSNDSYLSVLQQEFGTADRKALSDLAFAQPALKKRLEQLASGFVRPQVHAAFARPRVIIEFPLFFELPAYLSQADFVLALGCDDQTQTSRVCARDKMSAEKLERIRGAQLSTPVKAALADAYIDTSGTLESVKQALEQAMPMLRHRELQARCHQFFGSPAVWPVIEQAYSQKHRAYHTLDHLRDLFASLDPFLAQAPHARAIELAVWFHDFVYSTDLALYSQNESTSARAMLDVLKTHAPAWLEGEKAQEIALAAEFILATKKHAVSSPFLLADEARHHACALFLDADLSILAADPEKFDRYDTQIAREWGQDPAHASQPFCKGRASAMQAFSMRPQIFFSAEFQGLDTQARANLIAVVERWRARIDD